MWKQRLDGNLSEKYVHITWVSENLGHSYTFFLKKGVYDVPPPPWDINYVKKENVLNESIVCVVLSCLLIAALWSPAEKWLTSWLACMCFCHFPMWCPGSGVVLDCFDSWSLPSRPWAAYRPPSRPPPLGILYTMIFWNYTIYKAKWHMLALWQLGRYCVTALLTTLPYNSFQSSWANTNLYLNLIYQHANDLKITKLNAANRWYASIQLKSIILQIYTLLTFKYTTI